MAIKRRSITREVECRAEGDKPKISGYAAVFYREDDPGTEFNVFRNFFERIHKTAFNRALDEAHDVVGLFNHNQDMIIGRSSAGTLKLSVDDVGLRYEIDPPESRADVVEAIERGDVRGSSFAFEILEEKRTVDEDRVIFEIRDLKLYDVGPVVNPAYKASSSEARSDPRFVVPEIFKPENTVRIARLREIELG